MFYSPHIHPIHAKMGAFVPIAGQYRERPQEQQKSQRWILSWKDVRALVVSALIFLSVYAWVDVLGMMYRHNLLKKSQPPPLGGNPAPTHLPKLPHAIPEHNFDLDLRAKVNYALLLSGVTIASFIILSLM